MTGSLVYMTGVSRLKTSGRTARRFAEEIEQLREMLNRYFDLLEKAEMKTGYPQTSPLHVSWQPGKGGHRVLIVDIPAKYARLGKAIERLPDNLREAIIVAYGYFRDARLRRYTNREKAEILGVSVDGMRSMVHRAERLLLDMGVLGKKAPRVLKIPPIR